MVKHVTQGMIFAILIGIFIVYTYFEGSLSNSLLIILGGVALIFWWRGTKEKQPITLEQARKIAMDFLEDEQVAERVEDGTITLMPESELKSYIVISDRPKLVPQKYMIGLIIEGKGRFYYMIKVGYHGSLIGITKLDTSKHIDEIEPEIREVYMKKEVKELKGVKEENEEDVGES